MAYLGLGLLFFLMAAQTLQHDGKWNIQTVPMMMLIQCVLINGLH